MDIMWNISFDMAAVILLLVLFIWYLIEKRIPLRSHRIFLILITFAFIASSLEIMVAEYSDILNENDARLMWGFAMQQMFLHLTAAMFFWYSLVLADISKKLYGILRNLVILMSVILIVINALNPVLGWAYDIKKGKYISHTGNYVMFLIDIILLGTALVVLFRHVGEFTFAKTIVLTVNLVLVIYSIIIQVRYRLNVLDFAIAVGCLALYQYLNNPGAMTDSTTKLFNRSLLGIFLKNEFATGKEFDVVIVAIDDFKFVNKTYGVSAGDQMLRQIAAYLMSIKETEMVFRLGSDQFCVVVSKNTGKSYEIAKKIEARFKHPWYCDSSAGIMMSASICCIKCPKDATDYGNLIEVMDYSMFVAKKTNKGGVSRAEELELDRLREDKRIEKAVKLAIDRNELMVYYQPIYSVSHNTYNSAEALVRLNDSELGWISPEKFIPIAEKNGLIIQMGEIILEKVCEFIHNYKLAQTSIEYIEVNISPIQLVQENFAERVKKILEKYEVNPSQINMEITETATLTGVTVVNKNINELVEYGIKFSLDDYGSGYANIDYINNMPFSIIKLDKFIIWDAFKNEKAGITLEYTVGMLNALKLYIVAEGVETEQMKDELEKVGCHYMQGWYYSKAVSDEDFMKLIQKEA